MVIMMSFLPSGSEKSGHKEFIFLLLPSLIFSGRTSGKGQKGGGGVVKVPLCIDQGI